MDKPITVGSLFAGIGGFDLAAERVGWQVKWQVEIDDYATKVLEKHWPHVRRYRDIRAIDWSAVEPVDVVCGGFPCQPHSLAGRRLAAADDRDLWPEVVRCLREARPGWFLGENVSGLLSSDDGRFFGTVLRDLAACGYDAEWDCIPAAAVGAPHRRDRVWIVAYAVGDSDSSYCDRDERQWQQGAPRSTSGRANVAYSCSERLEERNVFSDIPGEARCDDQGQDTPLDHWWLTEPNVGRVAHGVPARVDRLRGLGNAIVPQVAEWIFRQIQAADEGERVSG